VKHKRIVFVALAVAITAIAIVVVVCGPYESRLSNLRDKISREVPIGSSRSHVIKWLDEQSLDYESFSNSGDMFGKDSIYDMAGVSEADTASVTRATAIRKGVLYNREYLMYFLFDSRETVISSLVFEREILP
jgi:hypothetical protein